MSKLYKCLERLSEKFWESPIIDRIFKVILLIIGIYFFYFFIVATIKLISL